MFILSENQFADLLTHGGLNISNETEVSFLDIGAGDGEISLRLAQSLVQLNSNISLSVYASESSYIMQGGHNTLFKFINNKFSFTFHF